MNQALTLHAPQPDAKRQVLEWKHLRGPDFEKLDRNKTVVCVSVSPLEVHGPHLPMNTDYFEAEGLTTRTLEMLHDDYPDLTFLRLPPLYIASDVLPHPGSVMFRSSTIINVLTDLGRSLAKQGFVHIWVSSFHGGPRHFVPIDVACHKTNKRFGTKMICIFSLLIKRLTQGATDLSDILSHLDGVSRSDLEGDSHAGVIETAMMLHLLGDQVDPNYKELEQVTVAIKREREGRGSNTKGTKPSLGTLLKGFREKLKYYEEETYAGHPAVATPELGRQILETLSSHSAEALCEVLDGKLQPHECYSPLWPVRWVFTNRWMSWLFEKLNGYRSQVW